MAHFVSLEKYVPSPEDDVKYLYAAPNGTAQIGLWGFKDGSTVCTVQVISGPGTATARELRGSLVQVWGFSGLTSTSRIQAFSGVRPFTGELEVRLAPPAASLGDQNKALLSGNNPAERAFIGQALVPAVPLEAGIGDYRNAPKMGTVRGLAVHITGGLGAANGFKTHFETNGISTHFVIDRGGNIVQYVAASIKSQAQGPGNGHFLSVEMVGSGVSNGACQEMTGAQMSKLRELWGWVRLQHPAVPNRLAWAYSGMAKPLSTFLTPLYRDMAYALSDLHYCNGNSESIPACIDSWGLSCHYWLDTYAKPCPGIAIMGQLPEVLGYSRVRVKGDEKFTLT
jgi:hypothetical protein